jgi:hypothetical protein
MNRLILFTCFCLIVLSQALASDCDREKFITWPEDKKIINRNPIIIFNIREYPHASHVSFAMGDDVFIHSELGKKISLFLKSKNSRIPLKLVQRNGGFKLTSQLIFKPARLLDPNTKYELSFSCSDSVLTRGLKYHIDYESRTWTTNEVIDKQMPVWNSKPQFLYKRYLETECLPSIYWGFCVKYKDASSVYIQTIVRNLDDGDLNEFFLRPDGNFLFVGYGEMCFGDLMLWSEENYTVSFNLVDASGNTLNQFSDSIGVSGPSESDVHSDEELEKCKCKIDEPTAEKGYSLNFGIVLGIIGLVILIALFNWFRRK